MMYDEDRTGVVHGCNNCMRRVVIWHGQDTGTDGMGTI